VTASLVWVVTAVAATLALVGLASTLTRRRTGLVHLAAAGVLEAVLLVQAATVLAAMAGGQRPGDTPTFLGYLIGILLVPIAGALWARTETTRWAGTVIAVAAVVVAVMDWRLLQVWGPTGA
jgi:hypothetical protein